ncbi:hypothetical protein JCM3765_004367 [Sporobolomyces pararoseus]
MSNCLPCTDPISPCQGCKKTQECLQIARTCQQCPRNICVDSKSSSSSSSGGGGTSTGVTAGATVGGVLGVAGLILIVWWFWWRPKGLQLSRKRYSKHLLNRQSKLMNLETKRKSTALGGGGGEDGGVATKRTSVHLRMENNGSSNINNNRRSSNGVVTGNLVDETVPVSRTSEDDNPFGDQNRSSIGTFGINDDSASTHTSEFSFRSSHSTNIIPIAYIPPHSSSLSVDDAQGRHHHHHLARPQSTTVLPPNSINPHRRRSSINNHHHHRASIPTSMASRDSLALAGAEIIELNLLPPVLTPDTPSIPLGSTLTSTGAPIRPPRSPGLDLKLPKTSSPLTSPPINSPHRFSSTQPPLPTSSTSSPTSPTYSNHLGLLPPPIPTTTTTTNNNSRSGSSQSGGVGGGHLSIMSNFTSRSNNSTMSYILDPPQIITPINNTGGPLGGIGGVGGSGGVKRVEFQQAKAHKLGTIPKPSPTRVSSGGGGLSPTSPLAINDPFSDDQASIEREREREGETGNLSRRVSSVTSSSSSRWTSTSSLISMDSTSLEGEGEGEDGGESSESVQFLQGQSITFTNPNVLPISSSATATFHNLSNNNTNSNSDGQQGGQQRGMSTLSVDLPRSARSSQTYSIDNEGDPLDHQRQSVWSTSSSSSNLTTDSTTGGGGLPSQSQSQEMSRSSTTETNNTTTTTTTTSSHDSLLAGIPFMAPPATTITSQSQSQSRSTIESPSPASSSNLTTNNSNSNLPAPTDSRLSSSSTTDSSLLLGPEDDDDSLLPKPFLPFAGQKPTNSHHDSVVEGGGEEEGRRVQSEQFSVRSGFGSGLSQIPFQLGFPSGFGDDDEDLEEDRSDRGSMLSNVTTQRAGERWSGRGIEIDQEEEEDDGLSRIEETTERGSSNSRRESVKSSNHDDNKDHKEATGSSSQLLPTPPASPPSRIKSFAIEQKEQKEVEEEEQEKEEEDPFGSHAEVERGDEGSDPRASMDTLALGAALSANLEAQG